VKLVDLKSLRYYRAVDTPWQSTLQCGSDDECHASCLKWLYDNDYRLPDATCVAERQQCSGVDAASMLHSSALLLFWPLLQQRRIDAPTRREAEFARQIDRLLHSLAAPNRTTRWSAEQALAHLDTMSAQFDGATHFAQHEADATRMLRSAAERFWNTAHDRCDKNRFC
jgi:hypothetical protein